MGSRASFHNHPFHPSLVVFPIAFFIMAFIMDVAYEVDRAGQDFVQYAYILIIAGIATALAAAIPGFLDYLTIYDEDAARIATSHMLVNSVVLLFESINLGFRSSRSGHYWKDGWIMSLLSVALMSFSVYLGHDLTYNYGMAVKNSRVATEYGSGRGRSSL